MGTGPVSHQSFEQKKLGAELDLELRILNSDIVDSLDSLTSELVESLTYEITQKNQVLYPAYRDHLKQLKEQAKKFGLEYKCDEEFSPRDQNSKYVKKYKVTLTRKQSSQREGWPVN